MYTGVFFLMEAIAYSILLVIIYFKKKIFKSKENKVYSLLVIISFIELILELILEPIIQSYQLLIFKDSHMLTQMVMFNYHLVLLNNH